MKLIRQPRNSSTCGQTCVAMIAGKTPDEVCKAIGRFAHTRAKQLIRGLRKFGIQCGDRAEIYSDDAFKTPHFSIVNLRSNTLHNFSHWVIQVGETVYDPASGMNPKYPEHIYGASFVRIFGTPTPFNEKPEASEKWVCPNCDREKESKQLKEEKIDQTILIHCGCYWEGGGREYHAREKYVSPQT